MAADLVTFSHDLASILGASEVAAHERAISHECERAGLWLDFPRRAARPRDPDGRSLTQEETDALIVRELIDTELLGENRAQLIELFGTPPAVRFARGPHTVEALAQRGGIHSEPLVRVLAFRAWGNRDRAYYRLPRRRAALDALLAGDGEGDVELELLFGGRRDDLLWARGYESIASWIAIEDGERWWIVEACRDGDTMRAARSDFAGKNPVAIATALLGDIDERYGR